MVDDTNKKDLDELLVALDGDWFHLKTSGETLDKIALLFEWVAGHTSQLTEDTISKIDKVARKLEEIEKISKTKPAPGESIFVASGRRTDIVTKIDGLITYLNDPESLPKRIADELRSNASTNFDVPREALNPRSSLTDNTVMRRTP